MVIHKRSLLLVVVDLSLRFIQLLKMPNTLPKRQHGLLYREKSEDTLFRTKLYKLDTKHVC